MKNSVKQLIFTIICIIIVFIPTYVAVTYFGIRSASDAPNKYTLDITDHTGTSIDIDENDIDSVAKSVLKMNSELVPASGVDANLLPEKYYDIKVTDNGTVSEYRYYFSTDEDKRTLVRDTGGSFYVLEFKHVKSFLSKEHSYVFYDSAFLPTLSIFGGDDIVPKKAEWRYKAVNGNFVEAPVSVSFSNISYAMSGNNRLSFSVSPDKCSVRVYQDGKQILESSNLDSIPYALLDSTSLSFVISAEWTGSGEYRGSAEYSFSSSIGIAPEFLIDKTIIESGEFFAVTGINVSAPQKIEFSSTPSINVTPVFFSEGNNVYALIPISKELPAPMNYVFSFTYGESVSELHVTVEARTILEREYNCKNLSISRNSKNIAEYNNLLKEICSKNESIRYFGDDFIDFTELYEGTASIILGYGHVRIPNNGDERFRLDGVDYSLLAGVDVPAIAAGKVVYSGFTPLIGHFVVIDHGFGLKTWYCNLSEGIAAVGTIVAKGETIGKAGSSGYINSDGVYLITTVAGVPVSPYPMQDRGLSFPSAE